MANTHSTLTELFTDIADAIKEKNGKTEPIVADIFPTEIENLKTGFDYVNSDITALPDYAFYGCEDLLSVDCYNLESIGASAFENCTRLKSVILYDSVTSIGEDAFKGCNEDLVIYCEATEKPESWSDDWNPDGCEVIFGFNLIRSWNVSATSDDNVIAKLYNNISNDGYYKLIISGSGNMKNYATSDNIPWKSYRNSIDFVNINNGVTSISNNAFFGCSSLTSVIIPDTIISIVNGDDIFYKCDNLIKNEYNNAYYIGNKNNPYIVLLDVKDKEITSYNININTKVIYSGAFRNCTSLTSITIPDSVTDIGIDAFENCTSLTSINIPDSVTSINNSVFYECTSLTSVHIPDSVTRINSYAFENCTSLTSINIPDSVTRIGVSTFENCTSLTTIAIPHSTVNVEDDAFRDCTSLASVNIGNNTTSIGNRLFYNCLSLMSINYIGAVSQWNAISFGYSWNHNTPDYTIYCTDGTISKNGTIIYY